MADLPREAAEGIAAARPKAEAELSEALRALRPNTDAVDAWLPAYKNYAAALFDGGARKAAGLFGDRSEFERFLKETLLREVVEGIMPDRSRKEAAGEYHWPKGAGIISTGPEDIPVVRGPHGGRLGAEAQRHAEVIYSLHGDLEFFLSEAGLRSKLFPDEQVAVRTALTTHLKRRVFYRTERLQPAGRKANRAGATKPPVVAQPVPAPNPGKGETIDAAGWDGIEISFLSDERVQIRKGASTETRNYAELGFADHRNEKPNWAWAMLRDLAKVRGTMASAPADQDWPKVEKRMQEIRKVLRNHFAISTDPVPFVKGTGYQACFKIGCSPSFKAYSGEADHDSGLMAITIPGHADHHRSEATLACFMMQE
jgi:hypothetical protein